MSENQLPRHRQVRIPRSSITSRARSVWLVASVSMASVACGPGIAAPESANPTTSLAALRIPLPDQSHYVPGETMRFEFRFRGVLVGRAALAVGEPGNYKGRPAIIVRSEVETTGVGKLVKVVHDDVRTWLDTVEGRPLELHQESVFGEREITLDAHFSGNQVLVEYDYRRTAKPAPTPAPLAAPVAAPDKAPVAAPDKAADAAPDKAPVAAPDAAPDAPSARKASTPVPSSRFGRVFARKHGDIRVRVRRRGQAGSAATPHADTRRRRARMNYVFPTGESGRDIHTVLGALRAFHGPEDTQIHFYGVSGRFVWSNELVYKGTEIIRTPMGLYAARRFEGVATRLDRKLTPQPRRSPRSYTLWLSDDHKRVPLRLLGKTEYGDVAIELVDYRSPDTATLASARGGVPRDRSATRCGDPGHSRSDVPFSLASPC